MEKKIAIIGLGYVGLPLAVSFASKFKVCGFDINEKRILELNNLCDSIEQVSSHNLLNVLKDGKTRDFGLVLTSNSKFLKNCNIFIVTVPTPVDKYNNPDLTPLINATKLIANNLKKGDVVIYESTVYPGLTEEKMVPILESNSNLKFNQDFYCGYSPERINPGDETNTLTTIIKVTSGSTPEIADFVDDLYKTIISAGTFKASSIKVAEAAKVIENAQRDINIAFVNELSKIFNLIGIDTLDVLKAASTKWNFLDFKPGLVGGHCIGVDPYYLAQKSLELGYHPEIILSGRRINDTMGKYIASEVIKLVIQKNITLINSNILILGFTFKENCSDVRNTKVIDIYDEFRNYGIKVDVYDPIANKSEVLKEYGINLLNSLENKFYSAVIVAVAHKEFIKLDVKRLTPNGIIYDVKGIFNDDIIDGRL